MQNPVNVCILRTDGTNCDEELAFAFSLAGGSPDFVHVNQLRSGEKKLSDYQILGIPGGFSYGDDVASGKILAIELLSFLKQQISDFVSAKKPVIGICNGFQVLVRTGLLPLSRLGDMHATLTNNDSGHFECRWIELTPTDNHCIFTKGMKGTKLNLPIAHGEGKFYAGEDILKEINKHNLTTLQYTANGKPTKTYPQNPNGSLHAIAGICDPSGLIFGMMPHPERFVTPYQHPNWRRQLIDKPHGLPIFENAVNYAKTL